MRGSTRPFRPPLPALLAAGLLAGLALPCRADLTVVQRQVQRSHVAGQPPQVKITTEYRKGDRVRIDDDATGNYQIIDPGRGAWIMVTPSERHATILAAPEARKLVRRYESFAASLTRSAASNIGARTGRMETISGFRCAEYRVTLGAGPGAPAVSTWLATRLDASLASQLGIPTSAPAAGGKEAGLVVRTETSWNGKDVDSMTEIQRISVGPIADSLFAIPTGYDVADLRTNRQKRK